MKNIYIPSKGRAKNSPFIKLCIDSNIKPIVIIEQEDYESYKAAYPTLEFVILPLSNKGITYVRNFIKGYATNRGESHYWMVDDDVSGIYKRYGTKLNKVNVLILPIIEEQIEPLNAAICSLEYRQYAWSANKSLIKNSFCDSFVFINTGLTQPIQYDTFVEGKEDRDFVIQCINRKMSSYRITDYAFSCPPNGKNAGGLKEIFYDAGREEQCALNMEQKWGSHICTKITKPDGRHDVKINWDKIGTTSLF